MPSPKYMTNTVIHHNDEDEGDNDMRLNTRWRYRFLQKSDLPLKAQRVIDLLGMDISTLEILHLESDPNGKYIKNFREPGINGYCEWLNRVIYLINNKRVGVTIHELMHVYIHDNKLNTREIGESFIEQHGESALSNYAMFSVWENKWDEVVCEIVAVYGRRGQFVKIVELLNLYTHAETSTA